MSIEDNKSIETPLNEPVDEQKYLLIDKVSSGDNRVSKAVQFYRNTSKTATEAANKIKGVAISLKAFVATLMNPATWVVVLTVLVVGIVILSALTALQIYGKNNSVEFCNRDGTVSKVDWPDNGTPEQRGAAMMTWLMSNNFAKNGNKPLTREQAAAISGNFAAESGIEPKTTEGHVMDGASNEEVDAWTRGGARGLGFAQWTHNPGRAGELISLARSMGGNWYDPEVQFTMIQKELDASYGDRLAQVGFFTAGKSIEDYSRIFHDVYEVSADNETKKQRRAKMANQIVALVGGGVGYSSAGGDNCRSSISGDWVYPLEMKNGKPLTWTTYSGSGNSDHDNGALDINGVGEGGVETDWPVYAIHNGIVLSVGDGNCKPFEIEHPDANVTSIYLHMNSIEPGMKAGAVVKTGQKIGGVGTKGCGSTGNHLHFAIHPEGKWGVKNPAHKWMLEKGVDMGRCVEGPCHLGTG